MVKLQIGGNTIYLTKQEQDFLFQLLDEKYDYIQNIPTFNAIRNWLCDLGCRPQVVVSEMTDAQRTKEVADYFAKVVEKLDKEEVPMVEDPWSNNTTMEEKAKAHGEKWKQYHENKDYDALRKLLGDLLKKDMDNGYYIAL